MSSEGTGCNAHRSAEWIAGQLTEAFGWEQAPLYIVRDRNRVYGNVFIRRLLAMGIRDRPIAPRWPWQNGYSERLIGSIRRDCCLCLGVLGTDDDLSRSGRFCATLSYGKRRRKVGWERVIDGLFSNGPNISYAHPRFWHLADEFDESLPSSAHDPRHTTRG